MNVQDEIREAAYGAIMAWRAGRPVAIPRPSTAQLVRMMTVSVGETIPDDYGPLMSAKLDAMTQRKPWSRSAHGACSRDDPHPKLSRVRRIVAP